MKKLLITTTAIASLALAGVAVAQTNTGGSIGSQTSTQTQGNTKTDVQEPAAGTGVRVQGGANTPSDAGRTDALGSQTGTQNSGGDQNATAASEGTAGAGAAGADANSAGESDALGTQTSTQNSGGAQTAVAETAGGDMFNRFRANMANPDMTALEALTADSTVTFVDVATLEQDDATMTEFMTTNSAGIETFRTGASSNAVLSARMQAENVDPATVVGYDRADNGDLIIYTRPNS